IPDESPAVVITFPLSTYRRSLTTFVFGYISFRGLIAPDTVVADWPSKNPALAHQKTPLQTHNTYVAFFEISRIQRITSALSGFTLPPGVTNTSGCGASANVKRGTTCMPITVVSTPED